MKNTHRYFCQAPSHQFIFFEKPQFEPQNPDQETTKETKEKTTSPLSPELIQHLKKTGVKISKKEEATILEFQPFHEVICAIKKPGEANAAIVYTDKKKFNVDYADTEKIGFTVEKNWYGYTNIEWEFKDGHKIEIQFRIDPEKQPEQVEQAETSEERIPLNKIIKILDNGMNATQNLTIPAQLKTRFEAANRAGYILQMGDGKSGEIIIFSPNGEKIKSIMGVQSFPFVQRQWAEEILDAIEYHQKMDGMIK